MNKILLMIAAMHARIEAISDKDRGATATEYAMLIAFVCLLIVIGVTAFGTALNNFFVALGNDLTGLF